LITEVWLLFSICSYQMVTDDLSYPVYEDDDDDVGGDDDDADCCEC